MRKLLIFLGATVGSTIGWYLGAPIGTMTAFMISTIGSGAGMYAGAKVAQHYG
jgi:phosphate/sulfate permease